MVAAGGLLLFALLPALVTGWSLALVAVLLQLPVYMLHQYEEHDDDRFRRFFNHTMFGGREVLSRRAVFVINVPRRVGRDRHFVLPGTVRERRLWADRGLPHARQCPGACRGGRDAAPLQPRSGNRRGRLSSRQHFRLWRAD